MEKLGLPQLNSRQIEELGKIVEETARQFIFSEVSQKRVHELSISVETEGSKPVILTVDVSLYLSPLLKNVDVQHLADQAVNEAFTTAENYLKELKCPSKK